jgi:putative ABC transport system permease protein
MYVLLLLSLPFLYVIVRRPVLRRLALRNAVRRPRETLLVIIGSLLGTAIMTGSFVVGDTFDASIRHIAHEQLGPVDEVVSTNAPATTLAQFTDPNVDGVLPLTLTRAAIATTGAARIAAPKSQLLETDFDAARRFGGDPHATGISGPTPAPGAAVIGHDLAHTLHARAGDEIEAFAYDTSVRLRVARVLPKTGVAGFWRGEETTSNNAFVAPGTIAQLAARGRAAVGTPPQSLVLVSNRGNVEGGARLTANVENALDARLAGQRYSVDDVKQTVLQRADRNGKSLSRLYSSIGLFAVLAGVLLLVNIFFMLADERKSELGMLRAVGLRRASLVGAFATEGWCYALVSAIAGTFVGLLLGRVLMAAAAQLFADRTNDDALTLHFAFKWSSVQRGLIAGFVIAVVTVLVTSFWLSRFNIIQAIRDINEPRRRKPRRRSSYAGIGAAVVGLLLVGAGVPSGSFLALMIGPVLVMAGITPMLARNIGRTVATTVSAIVVLSWAVAAVPVSLALGGTIDVFLFVLQGLVLVGAAVVLVAQHQELLGHAVSHLAPRSLHVRLGLAYPLARRFRTSMTLGMFALVVFILVMVSVFASMFSAQVGTFTRDISGGYNVVIQSNPSNPVRFDELAREPGVHAVAPLVTAPTEVVAAPGLDQRRQWDASGFDASFVEHGAPKLDDRGSYPTDTAAWRAVLADPNLAIVDKFFLAGGAGPPRAKVGVGDQFTMLDPIGGGRRTYTVAALVGNDFARNGVFVGPSGIRALVGDRAVANRAYASVDNPAAFTRAFAGRYLANGGQADTLHTVVQNEISNQQQFFLLMRSYLALGLVVGVAGIGVIMVRAVRERRRQVGVLRALGFQAKAVRAAFVVESGFVAVEGVIIGTVLALVCAWSMTLTDAFGSDIAFRVPVVGIGVLVVGTMLCALAATAAPARSASRIEPAVALRIAD